MGRGFLRLFKNFSNARGSVRQNDISEVSRWRIRIYNDFSKA
jgi:hypothetical protein